MLRKAPVESFQQKRLIHGSIKGTNGNPSREAHLHPESHNRDYIPWIGIDQYGSILSFEDSSCH